MISIHEEKSRRLLISKNNVNAADQMIKEKQCRGCPRGVIVTAMDYGIVVSEFVFQSRYYVHFQENTLGKGMDPLIFPAMG